MTSMGLMGQTCKNVTLRENAEYNKACFKKHKGNLATVRELAEALEIKANHLHTKVSRAKAKSIPTPVVICVNDHNHNYYYLKREFISWFNSVH